MMEYLANFDSNNAICAITVLISISTLISTLEWIRNWSALMDDGVLGWSLLRTRRSIWNRSWMIRMATPFLSFPGVLILLILRAIACVILLAFPMHELVRPVLLTVLLFGSLAMNIRSFPYGLSGPDRMRVVVFGALWLREWAPASFAVTQTCLWFIAIQCCLAYVTPGFTKLFSAKWRSGDALRITFRHRMLGHQGMDALLNRYPGLAMPLCWTALLVQLSFPLALLDTRLCLAYLSVMFLFHVTIAVLLGFNNFVWSWASTFPAVLYVTSTLR